MPKCRAERSSVTQPVDASYRYIPLTRNQVAIVDAEDFDWLNQWNWCAKWNERPKTFYAVRGIRPPENGHRGKHSRVIKMHREILKAAPDQQIDHINGNGLDNRRTNLRACTNQQNSWNGELRSTNKSGYKGVYWSSQSKRWQAAITVGGKRKHLGNYRNPKVAAKAYDVAAKIYFGEFARCNF